MKHQRVSETQRPWASPVFVLLLLLVAILAAALAGGAPAVAQVSAGVAINEFMASNSRTLADEDGDFSDWIELHNSGNASMSLAGFGLSDDIDTPFRWVLPDIDLPPGSHLLIWASGKNRVNPGGPLHTNFSISAGGEPLLLTHPTLGRWDEAPSTPLSGDISFGRQPDGSGGWFYFAEATPAGSNNGSVAYSEILAPPAFSHQAGFYTTAFNLTLSSTSPGAQIIYTLDGSVPDAANLAGQTYTYKNQYPQNPGDPFGGALSDTFRTWQYSGPLAIAERSTAADKLTRKSSTFDFVPTYLPQQPVFKGTVVRARVIKPGALPSAVSTNTYFVTPQGRVRYGLPVAALTIQENELFDYGDGVYTAGVDFDTWRTAHPNEPAGPVSDANWRRQGDSAEYHAHFELIEPGSTLTALSQDVGFRIHGNATRVFRMKSLRLYARSSYGASSFAYPIFPDQPYRNYYRLILRNSGNDFGQTMLRDAAIHAIMAPLGLDTQAYRPAVVFVNGEYWGIHNIRERYDKYYLAQVYGVDPENIDLLEDYGVVEEGDDIHYVALVRYITRNGAAGQSQYDYITTQMDVDNFTDYEIAEIFARNTDWPGNNISFWRLKTDTYQPGAPYGHDGRWRWLLFDTDFGFGQDGGPTAYAHDTLAFATQAGGAAWPNPDWSTLLLRSLLTNETFRQHFISRFADLLNTAFLPDRTVAVIRGMEQAIEPEMAEHVARWSAPASVNAWHDEVAAMVEFANQRPYYQRIHIRNKFGLAGNFALTVDVPDSAQGYVRVNTIELLNSTPGVPAAPYPWTGIYFQGIPVELEAVARPGYRFAGWQGLPAGTPALTVQTFTTDVALTAMFEPVVAPSPVLLHYWHFNDLPSGALTEVPADFSLQSGATITYPGTGAGTMDRVNDAGTELNARMDQPAGHALRVRNPSNSRELILALPTTGYRDVVLRYAVMRTDNGAQEQRLYYRTAETADWTPFGDVMAVTQEFQVYEFDFSQVAGVSDNAEFSVRILFGGENSGGSSGNNRFDNITVDALEQMEMKYFPVIMRR